tara:strand:+ start:82969 stop:83433 length:465 start_codon:yes stop_codon:yes gene_type:complete
VDHALIGGLGLACYGSTRATVDLDLLIYEEDKEKTSELLVKNGFALQNQSEEVLQFGGLGYVDLLIARRPISRDILKLSNSGGPNGINFVRAEDLIGLKIQAYKNDPKREFQDKADIQYLIESQADLDWDLIKSYANLFEEWEIIDEIRQKLKS